MSKPNPDKVIPAAARAAMVRAKDRGSLYSQYILVMYGNRGSLNAGCNARDLYAWLDAQENIPDKLKAKER